MLVWTKSFPYAVEHKERCTELDSSDWERGRLVHMRQDKVVKQKRCCKQRIYSFDVEVANYRFQASDTISPLL